MKKSVNWGLALVLVALAAIFAAPAMADPDPPPNDNVCICHNTQYYQNNQGNANDNQKVVIICVDPNSNVIPAHEKHGDDIVTAPELCEAQESCLITGPIDDACCEENIAACEDPGGSCADQQAYEDNCQ
jgi:hypothetical protein